MAGQSRGKDWVPDRGLPPTQMPAVGMRCSKRDRQRVGAYPWFARPSSLLIAKDAIGPWPRGWKLHFELQVLVHFPIGRAAEAKSICNLEASVSWKTAG
jgi:hypothetical protein